jgi:hypothetical protein
VLEADVVVSRLLSEVAVVELTVLTVSVLTVVLPVDWEVVVLVAIPLHTNL